MASATYEQGEFTIENRYTYTLTVTENWWQRYGNLVEFCICFTSDRGITKDYEIAYGCPKPIKNEIFGCLENQSLCYVSQFRRYDTSTTRTPSIRAQSALSANTEYNVHGFYIAEVGE